MTIDVHGLIRKPFIRWAKDEKAALVPNPGDDDTFDNYPPPWVFDALDKNFDWLQSLPEDWQPVNVTQPLGCGGGGCAFETVSGELVFKLSARREEIAFWKLVHRHPHKGVVPVEDVMRMPHGGAYAIVRGRVDDVLDEFEDDAEMDDLLLLYFRGDRRVLGKLEKNGLENIAAAYDYYYTRHGVRLDDVYANNIGTYNDRWVMFDALARPL